MYKLRNKLRLFFDDVKKVEVNCVFGMENTIHWTSKSSIAPSSFEITVSTDGLLFSEHGLS